MPSLAQQVGVERVSVLVVQIMAQARPRRPRASRLDKRQTVEWKMFVRGKSMSSGPVSDPHWTSHLSRVSLYLSINCGPTSLHPAVRWWVSDH